MKGPERIVFVGNCQIEILYALFERFISDPRQWVAEYVKSYNPGDAATYAAIRSADVVIEQVTEMQSAVDLGDLPDSIVRHRVPLVSGAFLWPFGGQARPDNPTPWFLPSGPYPAEMGDAFLNRLIDQGCPPQEGLRRYAELDVPKAANVKRRLELAIDRQVSRDQRTGYKFVDEIFETFRVERLFLTPFHLSRRLTSSLAEQFFSKIGADRSQIKLISEFAGNWDLFPGDELPVHPSVCEHFNIQFLTPTYKYSFLSEGRFSFEEYVLRYLRQEWNPHLAEGTAFRRAGNAHAAVELLKLGVKISPTSVGGWCELADAHEELGQFDDAYSAFVTATKVEPDGQRVVPRLSSYLARVGKIGDAEQLMAGLQEELCYDSAALATHAHCLTELGRLHEALRATITAARLEPNNPHLAGRLAHLALRLGRLGLAAHAIRRAIRIRPDLAGFHRTLAEIYQREGRALPAIHELKMAAGLAPEEPDILSELRRLRELLDIIP